MVAPTSRFNLFNFVRQTEEIQHSQDLSETESPVINGAPVEENSNNNPTMPEHSYISVEVVEVPSNQGSASNTPESPINEASDFIPLPSQAVASSSLIDDTNDLDAEDLLQLLIVDPDVLVNNQSISMQCVKEAVDRPIEDWINNALSPRDVLISRNLVACHVANAFKSGNGLDCDDQQALHYYNLSLGKLSEAENDYIGTNYWNTACHIRDITSKNHDIDDKNWAKQCHLCIKRFKQSIRANVGPTHSLERTQSSAWIDIAYIYIVLAKREGFSEDIKKTYYIKAFKSCLRALNLDKNLIQNMNVLQKALEKIKTNDLDETRINALILLGDLFAEEEFLAISKISALLMSILCYKLAYKAGDINSILDVLDVSIQLKNLTDEKQVKMQANAHARLMLKKSIRESKETHNEERKLKFKETLIEAERKYNEAWPKNTTLRKRVARPPEPSSSSKVPRNN